MTQRRLVALAVLLCLLVVSLACGDDDDGGYATQPPSAIESGGTTTAEPEQLTADLFSPSFTLEAPADWRATDVDNGVFKLRRQATEASPPGELWFSQLSSVYTADVDNAPLETPDDLAAFIREHPWLEVIDEESVEVGGLSAVKFELRTRPEVVPTAPPGEPHWWSLYEETIGTFNLEGEEHFALYVVNGPEEEFVLAYESDVQNRFDDFASQAEAIVATVEFGE